MKRPRFQKIKFDKNDVPYVTYYGKKLSLDEFQTDAQGNSFYCPDYLSSYILEIDSNGEFAKVIFEDVLEGIR